MTRHFGGIGPVRRSDTSRYVIIISAFLLVLFSFVAVVFLTSGGTPEEDPKTVVIHEPQIEMVEVLVPQQQIAEGASLEPAMFRKENRPKVGLSPSVVRDFEQIQGFYARSLILPDQPLHEDYVTKVKPTNQITKDIPDGFRAVTIRVDAKSAVEGWVAPGARVDVVWLSRVGDKPIVTVIVENSRILSVDRNPNNQKGQKEGEPGTVTLLVSNEDSQKIQLASSTGSLSLSLRGDHDSGKTSAGSPISVDDLLGRPGPVASAQVCKGKLKTCQDGVCEELCLTPEGKLTPLEQ
ncbi:MAG: Flp pilus assembly protein CpaB [Deltaproteobacteria bacterium]|nr:Flp pilus assembly protein CpaB [Deltaproteobacteria bacterium]